MFKTLCTIVFLFHVIISLAQTNKDELDRFEMSNIIMSGDTLKLKQAIIKYNYDINLYDHEKLITPLLHYACGSGDSLMVDFLLKNGANPNIPTRYALAANWAAERRHIEQIKQCMNNGLNPKLEEMSYWVSKYKKGDKDIPQWMNTTISKVLETDTISYQNYPYYQFTDPGNNTLLIASILYDTDKKYKLTKELIDAGVNVNMKDKHGATALYAAIFKSNPSLVKLLLKKGANVNQVIYNPFHNRNNNNESPLLFLLTGIQEEPELLSNKHNEVVSILKLLLRAGADVSIQTTTEQMTAMDIAKILGDEEIIKILRKHSSKQL
jgi:ankyrin repeat protein